MLQHINHSQINSRIPGGLVDGTTETFSVDMEPYTIYGSRMYCFNTTPKCRIDIYKNHMKNNPTGEKAMEGITGSKDDGVKTKQWMHCRFGGIDDTPDIDENNTIQEAEYVPCPKRGACPFEGIGCCTVEVTKGNFISKTELSILKLIGLPDKTIADTLCISTETVKTHIQNIRRKTNMPSKIALAMWAVIKGIAAL